MDRPADTPNPYESPQEVGYFTQEYEAWKRWLRDRIALVICGLIVSVILIGGLTTFLIIMRP